MKCRAVAMWRLCRIATSKKRRFILLFSVTDRTYRYFALNVKRTLVFYEIRRRKDKRLLRSFWDKFGTNHKQEEGLVSHTVMPR
jgi:hypothetical protein